MTGAHQPDIERDSAEATRRTHLALERTLLAWWRSGLAAMAVALAVGRLLPTLLSASASPFAALGVGFALLALAFIVYGSLRHRHVDRGIEGGTFRSVDGWVVVSFTVLLVMLAVSTIVLISVEG